ncbi:MAG: SDR family oxidoreductase [Alphaproteobacteria bacterium]|nr:SDR family oxidoreductase [Alphaproteobacteria bacterium]
MTNVNKAAIVTGSATGIGAATAKALAARGWHVLVNASKNIQDAEATAKACAELAGPFGAKVALCMADVAQDAECRRMVDTATQAFGRLDALVNNAAITKFVAMPNLDGLTADDFLRLCHVNVAGTFQMARAAAPALRATGHGSIVNISSNSAVTGAGSSIAYAASKGAVNTLTLSLARVLAPEIRVNAVMPGFTHTPWHGKGMKQDRVDLMVEHYRSTSPLRSVTEAGDVADAVLWFVEGAAKVTGQMVVVDSGNHMHVNSPPRR